MQQPVDRNAILDLSNGDKREQVLIFDINLTVESISPPASVVDSAIGRFEDAAQGPQLAVVTCKALYILRQPEYLCEHRAQAPAGLSIVGIHVLSSSGR